MLKNQKEKILKKISLIEFISKTDYHCGISLWWDKTISID
jgi:hypothetical protein